MVKAKGNMYILGENFTAADIIVGHCLRWSKAYGLCDNEVNCAKLGLSFAFEMFTAGGTTLDRIFMQTQGGSKTTNFNSTRFQSSTKELGSTGPSLCSFVPSCWFPQTLLASNSISKNHTSVVPSRFWPDIWPALRRGLGWVKFCLVPPYSLVICACGIIQTDSNMIAIHGVESTVTASPSSI